MLPMIIFVMISMAASVFIFTMYMKVFYETRRTSKTALILSYALYLVLSGSVFILNMFGHSLPQITTFIIYIVCIYILGLNYESSHVKRFFVSVFIYGCIDIAVYLRITLLEPIFNDNFFWNFSLILLTGAPTHFLITSVLRKFKSLKHVSHFNSVSWLAFFITPIATYTVIGITMRTDTTMLQKVAVILLSFAINIYVIYFKDRMATAHKRNLEAMLYEQEKEYYLAQCQLMQESADATMDSRHDMKAHLATLQTFISGGKADDATEYINNLLGNIGEVAMHSQTGNLALDSIINYKLKDIDKQNVKLDMKLKIPQTLAVDDSDIVTIISNLLDNALEAVAKLDEGQDKTVKLNVTLDKDTLLIRAENPFNGEIKENMESLKGGQEHGRGLKNIKRSVDRYNGYMKTAHENNIFSADIMLYGAENAA
ncbi:MAG: GHKL domain-containing protein [Defluviitaleaceae bacterium]|nr:GHKL domain-containing protein [Defluviitaleaceae bacterium]